MAGCWLLSQPVSNSFFSTKPVQRAGQHAGSLPSHHAWVYAPLVHVCMCASLGQQDVQWEVTLAHIGVFPRGCLHWKDTRCVDTSSGSVLSFSCRSTGAVHVSLVENNCRSPVVLMHTTVVQLSFRLA